MGTVIPMRRMSLYHRCSPLCLTRSPHRPPEHYFHERVEILVANWWAFFLPIAVAAGAFKDYHSIDELLAVDPPPGEGVEIEWSPWVRDSGIFCTWTKHGPSTRFMASSTFLKDLRKLAARTGIMKNLGGHSIRRESLQKADSKPHPPLLLFLSG